MPKEALITHRGRSNVSRRVWAAWEEAERLVGFRVVITQGSYQAGKGAAASAGTHDGGGAVDGRARDLSVARRAVFLAALRRVGFAAWLRTPAEANWPWHFHAVLKGDKDLAPGARAQVVAFEAGRNGLRSNKPDPTARPFKGMTWERYAAGAQIPGYRTLRRGATGRDVAYVQRHVGGIVADGKYGPQTEAAVKRYQAARRLTADGIVGPVTWRQILN